MEAPPLRRFRKKRLPAFAGSLTCHLRETVLRRIRSG